MVPTKDGYITGETTLKGVKKKQIIEECLEPQKFYDDWTEKKDSMRSCGDKTKIKKLHSKKPYHKVYVQDEEKIKKYNLKINRQKRIRKIKKAKNENRQK